MSLKALATGTVPVMMKVYDTVYVCDWLSCFRSDNYEFLYSSQALSREKLSLQGC